jgi:hypothetical protein
MALMPRNAKRTEETEKTSLIMLLICGLLFVGWVGEWPLEIDPVLYLGRWRSPFGVLAPMFAPVPGISLFPWQILLIALAPFCLGIASAERRHSREMDRAIFVSVVCIVVTFLWGWAHGGSPYFAYYQVWRFLAALLIAYMLMSAVRTERDLVTLSKVVVLAALIRATLCIYFYWNYVYGKIYPPPEFVTNHDDSILWVVAIFIVSTWALLKGRTTTWVVAALVVPCLFYAMVLNTRRLAWVELGLAMPLLYFLIGAGPLRSQINKWLIRAAPLVLIYIVAGLGSDSAVFAPVHALATAGSNYDPSSLTRQEEARNLLHTLVDIGNPILGTGWGRPYDKIESYWSNYNAEWVLTLYTPHNAILGLAAFSGLVGIIGIWGVVPMGAYLAARGYRGTTDAVPRAAGAIALGTLGAYSVHCYGDIGLQSFPVSLMFGAALATAGKVAVWSEAPPVELTKPTRGGAVRLAPEPRPTGRKTGAPWRRFKPSPQPPGPSKGNDLSAKPDRAPGRRRPR